MGTSVLDFLKQRPSQQPAQPAGLPPDMLAPPTDGSSVSDFLSNRAQSTPLQAANQLGEQDPARAARILSMQMRTGLPRDLIDRNLDAIEAQASRSDFNPDAFRQASPIVASWLAEHPDHLALAKSDLPKLSFLERQAANIKQQFRGGEASNELWHLGEKAILGTITPADRQRQAQLESQLQTNTPEDLGINGFWSGVPGAVAGQLPMLGAMFRGSAEGAVIGAAGGAGVGAGAGALSATIAGAVTGPGEAVSVPGGALAGAIAGAKPGAMLGWRVGAAVTIARMMGAQSYLDFEKIKDANGQPLGRPAALGAAAVTGVLNGAFEMIGLQGALKTIPGLRALTGDGLKAVLAATTTRNLMKRYLQNIGESAATMGFATFMQSVVKSSSGEIATMAQDGSLETASPQEILERVFSGQHLEEALASGKAGLQGGLGLGVAGSALSLPMDVQRIRRAQTSADFIRSLGETAESSTIAKTLPAKLQEVVKRLTADGPIETLYAPIDTWKTYWQSQHVDPGEAAAAVLGSRDAYDEAERTGADLPIPTEQYATTIAPTEHNAFWLDELRTGPDELSSREAREQLASTAETMERAKTDADEHRDADVDVIQTRAQEQLVAAGQDPETASHSAELVGRIYRQMSERLNVRPTDLFQQFGLLIGRGDDAAGEPSATGDAADAPATTLNQSFDPIQAKLEALKAKMASGELPTPEGKLEPMTRIDLTDMTHEEWWQNLGPGDQSQLLHDYAQHSGISKDLPNHSLLRTLGHKLLGDELGRPHEQDSQTWWNSLTKQQREQVHQLSHIDNVRQGWLSDYEKLSPLVRHSVDLSHTDLAMMLEHRDRAIPALFTDWQRNIRAITNGGFIEFEQARTYDDRSIPELLGGFFSKAERVIQTRMSNKSSVADVQALLKDVKTEERRWSGIDEVLSYLPADHVVTKQQILDALQGGRLEMVEINRQLKDDDARMEQAFERVQESMRDIARQASNSVGAVEIPRNDAAGLSNLRHALGDRVYHFPSISTSFSEFEDTFEKGFPTELRYVEARTESDARGILYGRLLQFMNDNDEIQGQLLNDANDEMEPDMGYSEYTLAQPDYDANEETMNYREFLVTLPNMQPEFQSQHFENVKNIVFHFRVTDRVDADGHKTLFVEEIQSDWHQQGREKGYDSEIKALPPELVAEAVRLRDAQAVRRLTPEEARRSQELVDQGVYSLMYRTDPEQRARTGGRHGVPDAPFKSTWHEVALKRVLRKAAEEGYDAIGWTTGITQSMRYNLSKYIDQLMFEHQVHSSDEPGQAKPTDLVKLSGIKNEHTHLIEGDASTELIHVIKPVFTRTVGLGELNDLVGKELAEKIKGARAEGTLRGVLTGDDLFVGGHGMRGFYDQMLPQFLSKFVKKYGATVDNSEVPVISAGEGPEIDRGAIIERDRKYFAPIHRLVLTPELKKAALDNEFALYQLPFQRAIRAVHDELSGVRPDFTTLKGLPLAEFMEIYGPNKLEHVELQVHRNTRPGEGPFRLSVIEHQPAFEAFMAEINRRVDAHDLSVSPEQLYASFPKSPTPLGHEHFDSINQVEDRLNELGFKPIEYRQDEEARGRIKIGQSGALIDLLKNADRSTFIHELGHFYLEMLHQFQGKAASVDSDLDILKSWMGITEDQTAFTREQHELFARGVERYLMEGSEPIPELRSTFERFRAWLIGIYQHLSSLHVELTDDVRGVMSRMLASRDELATVEQAPPLFADPKALGMNDAEATRYREAQERAESQAETELSTKLIQEFDREKRRVFQVEKTRIQQEVGEQANNDKAMLARSVLQTGRLPNGDDVPEKLQHVKLDRAAVNAQYPDDLVASLPRRITSAGEGIHPSIAADLFGFDSDDALLHAIAGAPDPRAWIAQQVDARMHSAEFDGTPIQPSEIKTEALKATHNEARGRLLQLELQHMAANDLPALKSLIKKIANPMRLRLAPLRAVRDEAERIVGAQRVRDVKPVRYQRAAITAGKDAIAALTKGDLRAAFEAKQRQLLNHELFRAASAARDQIDSGVSMMQRLSSDASQRRLGKAGATYRAQINSLLDRFDFSPSATLKSIDAKQSLREFIDDQRALGLDPLIPDKVLNEAYRDSYKNMATSDFTDVIDSAKLIQHLATLKNKLLANRRKQTLQAAVDEIVGGIAEHHKSNPEPIDLAPGLATRMKRGVKGMLAVHTKPEFLAEWLDGNENNGPAWSHLFKPFADAEGAEHRMMQGAIGSLRDIFSAYDRSERAQWFYKKVHIPEIGLSMTKSNLLAFGLNLGNDYNREAMRDGYGWTDAQMDAIAKHLDARDAGTIGQLWKFIDSFWPDVAKLETDLNGVAPEKVEASPVTIGGVDLPGGYYPIIFDARLSWRQAALNMRETVKSAFGGAYARAMTKHGHTEERNSTGGKPLRLELSGLTEHVTNVIHDLTHRRAVIDVTRLTQHPDVRTAIETTIGRDMYKQLNPWIVDMAAGQRREFYNPIEGLLARGRTGATIVNMGWKLTTAITQFLSATNTIKEIGPQYFAKGLSDVYARPWQMASSWNFVTSRSPFMDNRINTFDRDVRNALSKMNVAGVDAGALSVPSAYLNGLHDSYFHFIGLMDMAVSLPSWMGAYKQAMDGRALGIDAGDEPGAIDYADKIVRQTQGVGAPKDMAAVQRGSEPYKLFTMFYSYWSVLFNQFAKTSHQLKLDGSVGKYAASMTMLWFAPAVMQELITGRSVPNGDADATDWGEWLAKTLASYPFQTIILLRDVVNGMGQFGYEPSAGLDWFESLSKAGQTVPKVLTKSGEVDRTDVKAIANAVGYTVGAPTRQTWLTGEYLYDWLTGQLNEGFNPWHAIVSGEPK